MPGAKTNGVAGFSGVQCLNAVVWEVEDLCHTALSDGPIAGVMGCRLCATTVTERLQVFVFFFVVVGFFLILPLQAVRIENM